MFSLWRSEPKFSYEILPGEQVRTAPDSITHVSSGESKSGLMLGGTCVCLLATLVNLYLTIFWPTHSSAASAHLTQVEVELLRRPSQFIGLDYDTLSVDPKQFVNHPFLLTQIDRLEPNKVFDVDPKRRTVAVGTISPDDKRVQVNQSVFVQGSSASNLLMFLTTVLADIYNYSIQSPRLWNGVVPVGNQASERGFSFLAVRIGRSRSRAT